jgi:ankyrin repeat protein
MLLSAGADVNDRNSEGQTGLMMLREEGTSDIAWDLINAGADMNARDKDCKAVLDYAKENDHEKVVKLLQSYGVLEGDAAKEK